MSGLALPHHGLQVMVGLDDLDQALLRRAVAAIGIGVVPLDHRPVPRLDISERRIDIQAHHLQRFPLGIEKLARLRPGLRAGASLQLSEHAKSIAVVLGMGRAAGHLAGADGLADFPSWTMARQRVILVARDRFGVHPGEEIVGLIVFASMLDAEVPIFARIVAALWRGMGCLVLAIRPFASHRGPALLLRFLLVDANGGEEFGCVAQRDLAPLGGAAVSSAASKLENWFRRQVGSDSAFASSSVHGVASTSQQSTCQDSRAWFRQSSLCDLRSIQLQCAVGLCTSRS